MKNLLTFFCAVAMLSCASSSKNAYRVDVTMPDSSANGKIAYLLDFENDRHTDSAWVEKGKIRFEGTIGRDSIRMIEIDGQPVRSFILEPGKIRIVVAEGNEGVGGTPLNDELKEYNRKQKELSMWWEQYLTSMDVDTTVTFEQRFDSLNARFIEMARPYLAKHGNDALGAWVLRMGLDNMMESPAMFDKLLALVRENDYARTYVPVAHAVRQAMMARKTRPGMPFVDFTVADGRADGGGVSLSDYVGKGKFVLVDFWASWCGPCRVEMPIVAEALRRYGSPRFEVLGVAVMDSREATEKAVNELNITWPQIFNAGQIPTETYGITSLPQLILFDPDGKILARDFSGHELPRVLKHFVGGK